MVEWEEVSVKDRIKVAKRVLEEMKGAIRKRPEAKRAIERGETTDAEISEMFSEAHILIAGDCEERMFADEAIAHVKVSGEDRGKICIRRDYLEEAELLDLEETIAHEFAHLIEAEHGSEHDTMTEAIMFTHADELMAQFLSGTKLGRYELELLIELGYE